MLECVSFEGDLEPPKPLMTDTGSEIKSER